MYKNTHYTFVILYHQRIISIDKTLYISPTDFPTPSHTFGEINYQN